MKLFKISIVKRLFVPFVHVRIRLFRVVSGSGSQSISFRENVSLADSESSLLLFILVDFLLKQVKFIGLIVGAWSQILITICGSGSGDDFCGALICRVSIQAILLLLLLLNGSLKN